MRARTKSQFSAILSLILTCFCARAAGAYSLLTHEQLIDLTIAHNGRFFLPYQLYYSREQLKRSYPQIDAFFAAKRKYDPDGLFTNTFHQKYGA